MTGFLLYPASGNRAAASGVAHNVGTYGFTWGSAPESATGVHGTRFDLTASFVYPENGGTRSGGFTVRCVQE